MPRPGQPLLSVSAPAASALSTLPPLPASVSTIALWHSALGTSGSPLETWNDAVNAIPLSMSSAGNRPLVAADGSNFNARPIVHCTAASQQYMSTGVRGSPLWNAGAQIWALSVLRLRTAAPTANYRCYQTGGGGGGDYDLSFNSGDSNAAQSNVANSNTLQTAAGSLAVPHLYGAGLDAGQHRLTVDGASAGATGSSLSAAQCSLISIACYIGPALWTDLSMAMLWFLSGKPTAPEEAAILAWSRAYWGTP